MMGAPRDFGAGLAKRASVSLFKSRFVITGNFL
jgi:hypothetical protein